MEYSLKLAKLIKIETAISIDDNLKNNIEGFFASEKCTFVDVTNFLHQSNLHSSAIIDDDLEWRFVCVLCYVLTKFVDDLKNQKDPMLSVNDQQHIKIALKFIISLGMLPSFIPGVGLPISKRTDFKPIMKRSNLDILEKYSRLKFTCNMITNLCDVLPVKMIVYSNFLNDYICGTFQLAYAPLMKPNSSTSSEFAMTEEKYSELSQDQLFYRKTIENYTSNVYPPIIMKELIILLGIKNPKPPSFMIKSLTKHLDSYLLSENGVLYVIKCFFDAPHVDIGAQWKHIEKLMNLLSVKHGDITMDVYLKNISEQLINVIMNNKTDYVAVAAACLNNIHTKHPQDESVKSSVQSLISPLIISMDSGDCGCLKLSATELTKWIEILDLCFCHSKFSFPLHLLSPIIHNLFCIRTKLTTQNRIAEKFDNLILKHFNSKAMDADGWFSCLLYSEESSNSMFSLEEVKEGIHVKFSNQPYKITVEEAVNTLLEIVVSLKENGDLLACKFFLFCLSSLNNINSHITKKNKRDLLLLEDTPQDVIDKNSENYLIFSKALEHLANIDAVLNFFKKDPSLISNFIINIFKNSQDDKWFIQNEECISISLVLLTTILSDNEHREQLKDSLTGIREPLENLVKKSTQPELKLLCQEVLDLMFGGKQPTQKESQFEKTLTEICDPLLPVRAHGLLKLTKLIVEKDAETISKKHYVLCIFHENLKNEDSYVYLNAIKGLSSLAYYFTEEVLSILCKEFINATNKTNLLSEEEDNVLTLRLKIGEILVKTTKQLGEMAPAHKTILLNTFLCSCRDPDELIRASSFSNLAELCQIMHYKLGSIIYEILRCTHQAIDTEKSLECKRAAVFVISSLLKGLGSEALNFLKDELLPIYRTLKLLYHNENEDSVVRLHAQLGLEELNDIMITLMMPKLKMEKKIYIPSPEWK